MRETSPLRFIVAVLLAAAAWGAFLAGFGRFLAGADDVPAKAPAVMEMRLVDVEPPRETPAVSELHEAAHVPSRPPAPVHQITHEPVKPRTSARPAVEARTEVPQAKTGEQQAASPAPTQTQTQTPTQAQPQPAVVSAAAASQAPPTQQASGERDARLVSQPLPMLPDDLREDAYRADAVARFNIHIDGSAQVELIKPTSNPRLNQILLEALHKWRFFPAMENGRPVESRQDVHVRFNVS